MRVTGSPSVGRDADFEPGARKGEIVANLNLTYIGADVEVHLFDVVFEVLDEGVATEVLVAGGEEEDVFVHQGFDGVEIAGFGGAGPGGNEVADLLLGGDGV